MLGWAIVAQGGRWRANTGTKVTRTQSPIILDHIYITQAALSTEDTSNYAITVTRDPGQCIVQTRIKCVTVKPCCRMFLKVFTHIS